MQVRIRQYRRDNRDRSSLDVEIRNILLRQDSRGSRALYNPDPDWIAPEHIKDLDWVVLASGRVGLIP